MAEALEQVKRDLGRDAVILHTRTIRRGGWLGLGARNRVEVTASAEVKVLPRRTGRGTMPPSVGLLEPSIAEGAAMSAATSAESLARLPDQWRREMSDLRSLVEGLIAESRTWRMPSLPGELQTVYRRLVSQQVAEDIAAELVCKLRAELPAAEWSRPERVRGFLAEQIRLLFPAAGPLKLEPDKKPFVVALIGPTGVGKTTTIAKLAAHYQLRQRKRVGLVTIDTYRIAAVDQLKTYADILGVPLAVVLSPPELPEAIRGQQDRDLILIDTAGRSQHDDIKLSELRCFLQEAKPHETHLVLSSTSSRANCVEAAGRFSTLGADRIIFTKLDEAVGIGVMLDVLRKVRREVSYVTTGQNVPNDIEVCQSARLAGLIVGEG